MRGPDVEPSSPVPAASEARPGPRVELPSGVVEGIAEPGLQVFAGVQYAAAASGARRWRPPGPPPPWRGVRRCFGFGPAAIQAGPAGSDAHAGDFDCLRLNIWRPADGEGPWPVMVWIPGGGFLRGGTADPLYSGSAMARRGVVFVSVGYRLGVDGFMHFDDAAPNRGLQDVLTALRWINKHIALFGGDPGQVTLAGVSAGAGAIAHIMGMPDPERLFHRVILQSPSLQTHDLDDAARIRQALAGEIGVAPTRAAIAAVPLGLLTRTLHSFLGDEALKQRWGLRPRNFFPVRPVIDGTVVRQAPKRAVAARNAAAGLAPPVLLGCNAEEMRFYHVPSGAIDRVGFDRVRAFALDIGLRDDMPWPAPADVAASEGSAAGDLLCRIQTDFYYRGPMNELEGALRAGGCPTFLYEFRWRSPLHGGRMGAAHAMEIPFALGHVGTDRAREFTGVTGPCALSEAMHRSWVTFVTDRSPRPWAPGPEGLRIFEATG